MPSIYTEIVCVEQAYHTMWQSKLKNKASVGKSRRDELLLQQNTHFSKHQTVDNNYNFLSQEIVFGKLT